jgi:hypothetical protein
MIVDQVTGLRVTTIEVPSSKGLTIKIQSLRKK